MKARYSNIPNTNPVVKSPGLANLADCLSTSPSKERGTLDRAERTPGEVAVSGAYRAEPGRGNSCPGSPETNSEPFTRSEGFFIDGLAPPQRPGGAGGGSWSGESGDSLGVILEAVAKRSEGDYVNLEKVCPAGVITGSCANGHRFAKEVYCGREWCGVCNGKWEKGKDMLPSHARRFARWYPKAQQFDGVGYWTFTIPLELRGKYRTREALGKLGHQVVALLKSYGYSRGLRRWHFFGDKSDIYNPHLNCLVDSGFMGGEALRSLRREYSRILGVKLAIAEYHYFDSVPEKVHALKYVTRATFLDWRWSADMAKELRGFRNQLWWGSKLWKQEPVWSLDDLPEEQEADMSDSQAKVVASLESGICPYDGLLIEWERFLPISVLPELGGRSLGAGYWQLPTVRLPPYRLDFSELNTRVYWQDLLDRELWHSIAPGGVVKGLKQLFLLAGKDYERYFNDELEQAEADRALWNEVLEPAKNSSQLIAPLEFSPPGDKTIRTPNCLDSPPVHERNRDKSQGGA